MPCKRQLCKGYSIVKSDHLLLIKAVLHPKKTVNNSKMGVDVPFWGGWWNLMCKLHKQHFPAVQWFYPFDERTTGTMFSDGLS